MAVRYSPIYSTVWDDADLEGTTFEVHAFFVFLWSNDRIRPSGIYRATDEQLATASHLSPKTVRAYLQILQARNRIVRDGAWILVRGYLARQPNHRNFRQAVRQNIAECGSPMILTAFAERYPAFKQWVDNRLATVGQPLNESRPQSSTEQSSTEQYRAVQTALPSPSLPAWIRTLGLPPIPAEWWRKTLAGFPGLDHEAVARDAVAYWSDHRGKYRNVQAFLRNQFSRAFKRRDQTRAPVDPYAHLPAAWVCPKCGDVHEGPRDGPRICSSQTHA
jgi:hypothetical protein